MTNPFIFNKNEIIYNFINAALAGGLVMLGSFTTGEVTLQGCFLAFIAGTAVLITKFKEYWDGQSREYTAKIFNFL